MKSLEIVNNLINYMESVGETYDFTNISKKDCKKIKADLEVLEMIKKGIVAYQDKFTTALEVICAMFDFNEEEYNIIKQWLEENE